MSQDFGAHSFFCMTTSKNPTLLTVQLESRQLLGKKINNIEPHVFLLNVISLQRPKNQNHPQPSTH